MKQRIENARADGTAITHVQLKKRINKDYPDAKIANPDTDNADDLNAWIDTAKDADQLANLEG